MVNRRTRSVFGFCLALALLPLLSMAACGHVVREQTAMAWTQLQAKSPSSAQPVRSGHASGDAHYQLTPFAPAARFSIALSIATPAAIAAATHPIVIVGPAKLNSARAPPALS